MSYFMLDHSHFDQSGNIVAQLDENKPWTFVLIKAKWCGHCEMFLPVFEQLVANCQTMPINFAIVESTEPGNQQAIRNFTSFSVPGFPFLGLFYHDQFAIQYTGSRSFADLVAFLHDQCYM